MSLRRALGSLLARMFSPRATPRTAPARSLHSLRDLSIGDGLHGAAVVAAAALASGGTLAIQYFKKGVDDDESAAGKKPDKVSSEEDMKAGFEDWMKKHDKTYRDEEEKAMRFQVFKAKFKYIDPQRPENCFADWTDEEFDKIRAFPGGILQHEEYREHLNWIRANKVKGKPLMWRTATGMTTTGMETEKQGHTPATQVSA